MKKFLLLAVSMLCACGILAASALAADQGYIPVGAAGARPAYGIPDRQHRIAVNHATGDVYVADVRNQRIAVYRTNGTGGTLLTSFGTGVLDNPFGVAIDQDSGTVYVSDDHGVAKYDSDNATTPAFTRDAGFGAITATGPLAFDQTADQLLVADTTANVVRRYSAAGAVVSSFDGSAGAGSPGAFAGLQDLAIDSTGDIVVVDSTGIPSAGTGVSRIERFASAGAWEATIGPLPNAATVGILADNDEVVVSANQDAADRFETPTLERFSAAGTDLGPLPVAAAAAYSTISGIAADDGVHGRLFVGTDVAGGIYGGFYGLTSVQLYDFVTFPTVTAGAATGVAPFSAVLHGTVNPEGAATTYRFELSSDGGSSWTPVDPGGDGNEDAGAGTTDVAVTQAVTGLQENTAYQVRVVALRGPARRASTSTSFTTTDADDPTATIGAATAVTPTTATLAGTVNPQGGPGTTAYRFETSIDGGTWTAVDPDGDGDEQAGGGTTDVAVSGAASELEPGTPYRFRLVATKGSIVVTSAEGTFTTPPAAPAVIARPPTGIAISTAVLRSRLRSYGVATTYHFEYGTTTDYGRRAPVAQEADVAGTLEISDIQQAVSGLAAGTTYHYRVIAHNVAGTTTGADQSFTTDPASTTSDSCPNAAVRTQQHSEFLPDCRAYEQVSPPDKNGQSVQFRTNYALGLTGNSADGQRALYASFGNFADGQGGFPITYRAERSPSGWSSTAVTPGPGKKYNFPPGDFSIVDMTTPRFDAFLGATNDSFDPTDVNGYRDIYFYRKDERPQLVTRGDASERLSSAGSSAPAGLSDDGSTIFFGADEHLVPEDAGRGLRQLDLYVRRAGHTRLVNWSGGQMISRCGSVLGGFTTTKNALSADGNRAFFTVRSCDPGNPASLYLYRDGADPIYVSASQRSEPDAGEPQTVSFVSATPNQDAVYFVSGERLVDGITQGGLYRYDVPTGQLSRVLSLDQLGSGNPLVISDDGRYIWFASYSPPDADAPPSSTGVYLGVAIDGHVRSISALGYDLAQSAATDGYRGMTISADGSKFAFVTDSRVTDFDPNGWPQVYLADADSRQVICASCDPNGQRPAGAAPRGENEMRGRPGIDATLSADGRTLAFESSDRLVARDTNDRRDVYAMRDGKLALLTTGRSQRTSRIVSMDRSGSTVFIDSPDALVPSDTDAVTDMYAVRIDGGFLEPETESVLPCGADACQGAPAAPAAPPTIASLTIASADPAPDGRTATPKPIKVSRSGGALHSSTFNLKVTAPGKGRLTASGPRVRTVRRTVTAAGTLTLKVSITAAAKRSLQRNGRVTIKIRVGFTPESGRASVANLTVTISRASAAAQKRTASSTAHRSAR